MTEKFPRVLVLSSSVFNDRTGGGITLTNLFRGWPQDRLAAAHSDSEVPSTEVCSKYYALSARELGREAAFNAMGRGPQDRGTLTPELLAWVKEFQPGVIYTLLGSLGYVRLAGKLADATGAAIVPHMMDDWPSVIYGDSFVGSLLRRRLDAELRKLLNRSALRLAISPAMASEYQARYGGDFHSVSNPVDAEKWKCAVSKTDGRPILLYVGSVLAEAQLAALTEIAAATAELNSGGSSIRLIVATPNAANVRTQLGAFGHVELRDVPGEDGIAALIGSADLLLLPANFNPASIKYLRLSNPTKIPAYMASGIPILVYAPSQLDMTQRALRDGWGIVVSENDRAAIGPRITEALGDSELRKRVVDNAARAFARDHDSARVRDNFRQLLAQAAGAER